MKTLSKRLTLEQGKVTKELYDPKEAISLLKSTSSAKFDESMEAHISLAIDPKYSDQQLRTTVVLPNGTGKSIRIAALVTADQVDDAEKAGADVFGNEDLIEDISKGILNFELLIATPPMMPKLAKLGRVLGPKGLMPSPKAGTVTTDTLLEFNSPLAQILLLDILTELKGTFFADSPSTFSDYLNSVNLPEISVKGFETLMTYFICESPTPNNFVKSQLFSSMIFSNANSNL